MSCLLWRYFLIGNNVTLIADVCVTVKIAGSLISRAVSGHFTELSNIVVRDHRVYGGSLLEMLKYLRIDVSIGLVVGDLQALKAPPYSWEEEH